MNAQTTRSLVASLGVLMGLAGTVTAVSEAPELMADKAKLGRAIAVAERAVEQKPGFEFTDEMRKRVRSELGLRDVQIQRLSVERKFMAAGDSGSVERVSVQVDLDGHARTLKMEPHSLRSEGFAVYVGFGPGANDFAPIDREFPVTTYRGWVEREEGDGAESDPRVVGSYFGGKLRASVHDLNGVVYRVQPLSEVIEGAAADVYAVYRDDDLRGLDFYKCGVGAEHMANVNTQAAEEGFGDRGVPACLRQTDVLFDTDYEYTTHFLGRPDQLGEMTADIEFINNECDFVFARDMGANQFIIGLILRTDPADPFSDVTAHGSLLGEFRALWAGVPLGNPNRDVTHLMTGRDLDGGVIGVAYLPSVCRQDPNVGLSQTLFASSDLRRLLLTAHELGHQWNAPHDNQAGSACESTPSGFIMNPSIGTQPAVFSDCSKDRMTSYLASSNGDCISSAVQGPLVRPDFATVYIGDTVDVDVLRNETSSCGPMTFALSPSTSAQGGTLTLLVGAGPRGRNMVRYTPPVGFTGTDTFTYTVTNAVSTSAPVTATVLVLPRKPAEFPIRTGSGVHVYYYETSGVRGLLPDFTTLEPYLTSAVGAISFTSTTGNFAGSGRADAVGAVFEGFFNVTTAGVYTFFTESDDGSKLFIGDTLVVSNDSVHGMQERAGKIGLEVGKHSLRVEFFERDSSAGLIARVQGPGLIKQVIPSSRFSRRLPCPPDVNGDDSIDLIDLLEFVNSWSASLGQSVPAGTPADYNADLVVDLLDLLGFVQLWLSGQCV